MKKDINVENLEFKDVRYKDMPECARKDFFRQALKQMCLLRFSMIRDVIQNRVIFTTVEFKVSFSKKKAKRKVRK